MFPKHKKRAYHPQQAADTAQKMELSQKLIGKQFIDAGIVMKVCGVCTLSGDCLVQRGRKQILYDPKKIEPLLIGG